MENYFHLSTHPHPSPLPSLVTSAVQQASMLKALHFFNKSFLILPSLSPSLCMCTHPFVKYYYMSKWIYLSLIRSILRIQVKSAFDIPLTWMDNRAGGADENQLNHCCGILRWSLLPVFHENSLMNLVAQTALVEGDFSLIFLSCTNTIISLIYKDYVLIT